MIEPPAPGVPTSLLGLASSLRWRAITRSPHGVDLGEMVEPETGAVRSLVLARGGGAVSVMWALLDGPARPPLCAILLDLATFEVLRAGCEGPEGAVLHDGQGFRLRFGTDGVNLVASAIPLVRPDSRP